jgi:hypothetical protein
MIWLRGFFAALMVAPALVGGVAAAPPEAARPCTVQWRNDRHIGRHVSTACLPAVSADRSRVAVLTVRDAEFTIDVLAVDRPGKPVETFEAPDVFDQEGVRSALRDANRALARGRFRRLPEIDLGKEGDPWTFRIEARGLDIRYGDNTLEVRRDGAVVGRSRRHEPRHDRDPGESEHPMISGIYVADDRAFVLIKIEYMGENGFFLPDADWEVVRLDRPAATPGGERLKPTQRPR